MSVLPTDYNNLNQPTMGSKRTSGFCSVKLRRSIIVLSMTVVVLLLVKLQFMNEASVAKSSNSSLMDITGKRNRNRYQDDDDNAANDRHDKPRPSPWKAHSTTTNDGHDDEIAFRPLVISGPSGVGKGTLIEKLVSYYNHKVDKAVESHEFRDDGIHELFGFSVSHTTRGPRPGEVDGIHYHFTTKEQILKDIEKNKFIEHAEVHGNIYGTSYESVQNVISSQEICILDIDVQGAKRVKEDKTLMLRPYFIFIAPPSMEALEERLRGRGTETEEAIKIRLGNAKSELDYGTAQGNFDEVIVNDDIDASFLHLRQILEHWYPHLNQIPSPSYDF